ncbi:heavy metal sensor histidine kinase [Massilia sp. YMA4]|uniref:Sensor protein n=1 Tax=[Empedobacter] haloabium TaxID=592317 RepID=A0ABZ1UTS9_9BURK|nr:heavy metal sensor histidine kinase [Massilia sp. YMA4]AXA91374.1 two-component sensor histidine kinase [Massilia sp. YMA4]
MSVRCISLTLRLSALVAMVAFAVFSAVGIYLYRSLAGQLQERDDADLVERAELMRHFLDETSSTAEIRRDPHRFLDAASLDGDVLLVMQAPGGAVLAANAERRAIAPHVVPLSRPPVQADVNGAAEQSTRLRVLAVLGRTASGEEVRVTLARIAADRSALLATYRWRVLGAALLGAAITALLGALLIRRGLARVTALAEQARHVSAQNLRVRLDAAAAPMELRVLADSFNEVLDRLEASFDNLSQFADDLAHDMRTPLNNLMVQTEVMLSQARPVEDYQTLLHSNHEEFGRLARMVESMLFLARADHDEVALSLARLDLYQELTRIAEYFEGPALDAGVQIEVSAVGMVVADAHLLRRAVSNLVSNALRYTPRGNTVRLDAGDESEWITISVTNPGRGIAPEHIDRLFDRFYRADPSRSSASGTSGLGLAIVKSIMTLQRGRVAVTSGLDGETRFCLLFPRRQV